jgi:hypothetical protein
MGMVFVGMGKGREKNTQGLPMSPLTKDLLHTHFEKYYAIYTHSLNKTMNTHVNGTADDSPLKVNFTSRYKRKDYCSHNELDKYFKLPCEDFEACQSLQWWVGRQAQFPALFCLVCDVFSIPGKCIIFLCVKCLYSPH